MGVIVAHPIQGNSPEPEPEQDRHDHQHALRDGRKRRCRINVASRGLTETVINDATQALKASPGPVTPCSQARALAGPALAANADAAHVLLAVDALASGAERVPSREAIFLACLLSCFFFLAISRWRFSKE